MSVFVASPAAPHCSWEGELAIALHHQLEVERSIREIVAHARSDEHSASWADVAAILGVSRQAARQRFA